MGELYNFCRSFGITSGSLYDVSKLLEMRISSFLFRNTVCATVASVNGIIARDDVIIFPGDYVCVDGSQADKYILCFGVLGHMRRYPRIVYCAIHALFIGAVLGRLSSLCVPDTYTTHAPYHIATRTGVTLRVRSIVAKRSWL
jgi:hypothetical protein